MKIVSLFLQDFGQALSWLLLYLTENVREPIYENSGCPIIFTFHCDQGW